MCATPGATLTLVGPEPSTTTQTATSGADGTYQFANVVPGVYLLTPSRGSGWTFVPANVLVTMAGASLTGPDFVSIAPTHDLTGRVTGAVTSRSPTASPGTSPETCSRA
jgi:hypothetical protein